jgi:hypothetical protein
VLWINSALPHQCVFISSDGSIRFEIDNQQPEVVSVFERTEVFTRRTVLSTRSTSTS